MIDFFNMPSSTLLLLSLGRYLCWFKLLAPEGIIHPLVSTSLLTWFIRYMHYYRWIDTSTGGLLVPGGIIHPFVSTPMLTLVY